MDSQPAAAQDNAPTTATSNGAGPSLDPLRRVFVAREYKTPNGTTVMQTLDGEMYMRHTDGSIRSVHKKVHGKAARKQRARLRHGT